MVRQTLESTRRATRRRGRTPQRITPMDGRRGVASTSMSAASNRSASVGGRGASASDRRLHDARKNPDADDSSQVDQCQRADSRGAQRVSIMRLGRSFGEFSRRLARRARAKARRSFLVGLQGSAQSSNRVARRRDAPNPDASMPCETRSSPETRCVSCLLRAGLHGTTAQCLRTAQRRVGCVETPDDGARDRDHRSAPRDIIAPKRRTGKASAS